MVFCAAVNRSVNGVISCGSLVISCGSIVVNATIEVDTSDDGPGTSSGAAPKTRQEVQTQLQKIMNDAKVSKYAIDIIFYYSLIL